MQGSYIIHKTGLLGRNNSTQPIRLTVTPLWGTVHWQYGTIAQCYTMRESCRLLNIAATSDPTHVMEIGFEVWDFFSTQSGCDRKGHGKFSNLMNSCRCLYITVNKLSEPTKCELTAVTKILHYFETEESNAKQDVTFMCACCWFHDACCISHYKEWRKSRLTLNSVVKHRVSRDFLRHTM